MFLNEKQNSAIKRFQSIAWSLEFVFLAFRLFLEQREIGWSRS